MSIYMGMHRTWCCAVVLRGHGLYYAASGSTVPLQPCRPLQIMRQDQDAAALANKVMRPFVLHLPAPGRRSERAVEMLADLEQAHVQPPVWSPGYGECQGRYSIQARVREIPACADQVTVEGRSLHVKHSIIIQWHNSRQCLQIVLGPFSCVLAELLSTHAFAVYNLIHLWHTISYILSVNGAGGFDWRHREALSSLTIAAT